MKEQKYGYNFTEDEEGEEERCKINFSVKNVSKPETEDSTFVQFLLNRIIKNSE